MTPLETLIVKGVRSAAQQYESMAECWLSHAPESFLQTVICQHIAEKYCCVSDTSVSKLRKIYDDFKLRKLPNSEKLRPDIIVLAENDSNGIECVIEVKRSWSIGPISGDVERVRSFKLDSRNKIIGYVVGYCERKSSSVLQNSFKNWAAVTNSTLIQTHVSRDKSSDDWHWGFALLRV